MKLYAIVSFSLRVVGAPSGPLVMYTWRFHELKGLRRLGLAKNVGRRKDTYTRG